MIFAFYSLGVFIFAGPVVGGDDRRANRFVADGTYWADNPASKIAHNHECTAHTFGGKILTHSKARPGRESIKKV